MLPNMEAVVQSQTAEENPALTLTGQPAPAFELPLLGQDKPFNVKASENKEAVVLGFWATMLGEETSYFDVLQNVDKELGNDGIRVVTVNLGDPAEEAAAYLKAGKWKLPVVLDLEADTDGILQGPPHSPNRRDSAPVAKSFRSMLALIKLSKENSSLNCDAFLSLSLRMP